MSNICTRCGNERKLSKTWEEEIVMYGRTTKIKHEEFVCNDAACQKIVEGLLLTQKEKRESLERQKEQEKQAKIKRLAEAKLAAAQ